MYNIIFTKSSDMLNRNTYGAKKGKANQKQQLLRRAVVSREAKKKQQARAYSSQCDHYSELFTRMVGLNF